MRRAVAHAFVEDLGQPVLAGQDVHHFSRVLRLRPGEVVSVSDGQGGLRLCEWLGGELAPLSEATREPPPSPPITVGFALTKGEHPEWAVQKLTETGADHIVIMVSDRCVARWTAATENRNLGRLREIARQAAMQSRRRWLPSVEGPVPFSALAGSNDGQRDTTVAIAVQGGGHLALATPTVLVGPEGGWSEDELAAVPVSRHVGLGPNVLRAETAAVAAGVLLAALRGGLILSAPVAAEATEA
jgi:16S rRNA (uracil1498-N3)-methyltransferase